ncbi:unnamed protein product [Lactuca virosa]|uniref:Protein kinase domain-containing protein n=1 Tax=Lactuca virosa TaxID=75947 RepID=A0AAU9MH54_9ASTR|nr:unnamed protein product [Lactuca virosa]
MQETKHKSARIGYGYQLVFPFLLFSFVLGLYEYERRKRDEYFVELTTSESFKDVHQLETDGVKGNDLLLFSFPSIMAATNDFSVENKLGQGGFGPVYKGKLSDGREIAIKRLQEHQGKGLWNSRMN